MGPLSLSMPKTALWLYRLLRICLGTIFIWSGLSKLMAPEGFAAIIQAYGLIPEANALSAAVGLSILETAAGMGLVMDVQWSLPVITGQLVFFMAILGYGLWLGLDVDCGCFGPGDPEAAAYHSLRPALYRDICMLAGIGCLFVYRRRQAHQPLRFSDLGRIYTSTMRRRKQ